MFINNSNNSSVLLRMGEGCVTNCYNCSSPFDNKKQYKLEQFMEVFKYIKSNFDNSFSLFFYGIEMIFHDDIEQILGSDLISGFRHSLHISPLYSYERVQQTKYLASNYPNVFFETCYTVKSYKELKLILKLIGEYKKHGIKASMDLFLDFPLYLNKTLVILNKFGFSFRKTNVTSHLNYDYCINCYGGNIDIILYHTQEQFIANSRIYNIPNNGCVSKQTFDVEGNNIKINEEIEITKEGIFKMHINTYCSKAIQKISSIYNTDQEIINDFNKLDIYLSKYNSYLDMGKNCFDCISNPYQ